jgi:DNA polymerase III alpha subunit
MKIDPYGKAIVNNNDIFTALYNGSNIPLDSLEFEDNETVDQFNTSVELNADPIPKIKLYQKSSQFDNREMFDKDNQSSWFMPKRYCENLIEMLFDLCETQEQTDRVNEELELFIQHGMLEVLFYLKYLVDTMRENKIVWGVGRGSSVASYVLFLLGVHKIDSIKYNLDIKEFLK